MRRLTRMLVAVFVLATSIGCERDDPKLEAAANAINASAEDCLKSVRDQHTRYDSTPACNALSALAMAYVGAGGDKPGTPPKYDLKYVGAQRMAWTAVAMSESCAGRPVKIW